MEKQQAVDTAQHQQDMTENQQWHAHARIPIAMQKKGENKISKTFLDEEFNMHFGVALKRVVDSWLIAAGG